MTACLQAVSQSLPDSIVIHRLTYVADFIQGKNGLTNGERLQGTDTYSIIRRKDHFYSRHGKRLSSSRVKRLLAELQRPEAPGKSLAKFGIDTHWIKNNLDKVLKLSMRNGFEWNARQRAFIFEALTNWAAYEWKLNDYLSAGGGYTMHHAYRSEIIIDIYRKGAPAKVFRSRKSAFGYKMPWTNMAGDLLYNYDIERSLHKIFPVSNTSAPLKGKKLLRLVVNDIISRNEGILDNLR
ncbi:MAG TPA: hypothetical protein VD993_00670 [Chitinophagaceae bacterium]|nr:hypothetical protein [Chitinophagaceae bacterium]